jgi:CHAP domain
VTPRRTLHLTSPPTRGKDVHDAHWLLSGNGPKFKSNFHPGPNDGEYGPNMAAAARRAKYALGYPAGRLDGKFGQKLYDLMTGTTKLPTAYALRRSARLALAKRKAAEAAKMDKGHKAIAVARTQIGYRETPVNRTKFGRWYGVDRQPWCAIFVSWCMAQAGSKFRYSYVPAVVDDARHGRNGLRITSNPQRGDLVCFDWNGGVADHIGFFDRWTTGGNFLTVEGNTGDSNWSNGGAVMSRERSRHQVEAFVKVNR